MYICVGFKVCLTQTGAIVGMATGRVRDGGIFPAHIPTPIAAPFPIAGKKISPISVPHGDLIPNGPQWGFLPVMFSFPLLYLYYYLSPE